MNNQGKGFGFGLGKMKELAAAFQKAQQIQEDAKNLQAELEAMEIEAQSEDGFIIVKVTGDQKPISIDIKPEALEGKSAAELSTLVTTVVKDAYQQSTDIMRERMESLTGNLGLPGM